MWGTEVEWFCKHHDNDAISAHPTLGALEFNSLSGVSLGRQQLKSQREVLRVQRAGGQGFALETQPESYLAVMGPFKPQSFMQAQGAQAPRKARSFAKPSCC